MRVKGWQLRDFEALQSGKMLNELVLTQAQIEAGVREREVHNVLKRSYLTSENHLVVPTSWDVIAWAVAGYVFGSAKHVGFTDMGFLVFERNGRVSGKPVMIVTAKMWKRRFAEWEAGTLAPGDRYLTQSDGLWIACDNANGDFLVEEFNTREEALGWLRGEFEVFDSDPDLLDYEEVDGELVWADGEKVEGIVDYDQKRLFEDTVDLVIDRVISELQQGLSFGKGTLETIRIEVKKGRK